WSRGCGASSTARWSCTSTRSCRRARTAEGGGGLVRPSSKEILELFERTCPHAGAGGLAGDRDGLAREGVDALACPLGALPHGLQFQQAEEVELARALLVQLALHQLAQLLDQLGELFERQPGRGSQLAANGGIGQGTLFGLPGGHEYTRSRS